MKLAFVHLMRTGGSYVMSQCAAAGLRLWCGWACGYGRDWNRAELFSLMRRPDGVIHNHIANWDAETIEAAKGAGWRTFAILRNPCTQLPSLWNFIGRPATLDEFVREQLAGDLTVCGQHALDYRSWAVPWWWIKLDVLLRQDGDLDAALSTQLGIEAPSQCRQNVSLDRQTPSNETLREIRLSCHYRLYQEALACAS